ncbi:HigA family addiction module antitoxin [Lentilactobacillus raoultii]|uniref:HigA family addiction module antitoxin n=1 Tax=Lentilactobacillus raoultii TaxID=1987503 RepID=A0ABW3PFQ8_9LACO|nr:HigA family addiction module antitoxin [Lentilactobacillus raoultii]
MNEIPTPKISEILKEEFMEPLNLSVAVLSRSLHMSELKIQDLLDDRCKMTADVSAKLGRFFNISDDYFLKLQTDIDRRNGEKSSRKYH